MAFLRLRLTTSCVDLSTARVTGDEAGFFVRGEGVFEEGIPAEVSERHEVWGSGWVGDGSVGGDDDGAVAGEFMEDVFDV